MAIAQGELPALTNGQLIIGSTGAAPVAGSLASADGSVTFTASAGGLDLSAPGAALISGASSYFLPSNAYPIGSLSSGTITANNAVHVFRFLLPASLTITAISFNVVTNAAGLAGVGIYSAAGSKLVAADGVDVSSGTIKTTTVTTTALVSAMYYLAWTCSTTNPAFSIITANGTFGNIVNAGTVHQGTAANASASGVLPATLGVVSGNTAIQILVAKLQG